jgi:hypothetical protein
VAKFKYLGTAVTDKNSKKGREGKGREGTGREGF